MAAVHPSRQPCWTKSVQPAKLARLAKRTLLPRRGASNKKIQQERTPMTDEFPKSRTCPQSGPEADRDPKPDRRTVVKGAAAASIALPTYLRDFSFMQS